MRKTTWALLGFLVVLVGTFMAYFTGVIGFVAAFFILLNWFAAAGFYMFVLPAFFSGRDHS